MNIESSLERILWIDDQTDVAKTLAALLADVRCRVTFVDNGTDALGQLCSGNFALAILDLMIPPGVWGGLWLLEQIADRNLGIPILVLSGEGTQIETIKAMRLGAKDYVRKEEAQSELARSVQTLLEWSSASLDAAVASAFPTPLAISYRRLLSAQDAVSGVRMLASFYEQALRFCSLIGVAQAASLTERRFDLPERLAGSLGRPSMGTWNQLRHWLAQNIETPPFSDLTNAFDDRRVQDVIAIRNEVAHGGDLSVASSQEKLNDWLPATREFVRRLRQRGDFKLVMPLHLDFDGRQLTACGLEVSGDSVALPRCTAAISSPITTSRVHLLRRIGSEHSGFTLHPYVLVEPGAAPDTWHVLVCDALSGGADLSIATGAKYIDVWSGQRTSLP